MTHDMLIAAGLSIGVCLLVGLAGAVVLRRCRRGSLRTQLTLAALIPLGAVVTAVLVDVVAMFLSTHDASVLLVALATAVVLGVVGAAFVTRPVLAGFGRLSTALDDLVDDAGGPGPVPAGGASTTDPARPVAERAGLGGLPAELAVALRAVEVTRRSLAESRQRERASETARRELVGFMSHDLRTPLAGLRAVVEGLEDGIVADVPRALEHIRSTVGRMSVLVDDLFALSRVQGPGRVVERHQVSLAEIVGDVVAEASPTATAAGVALRVRVPADDRLAVSGHHANLTRALTNLVVNAIHHTDAGHGVEVRAGRTRDGAVHVEVMDRCGGIPEDNLHRVFEAGWRGNPARSGEHEGAGLGLAIVRGVAESHEGRVGVRNSGEGCVFALELPPSLGDVDELART